jgi:hypothetical protein
MAQVTVFVDDAVRGTLPAVCVKDGVATADRLVIRDEAGNRTGLGVAWLLLLLGPPGWLGLLLISFTRGRRPDVLTVELPMSEPAYQRVRAARRLRRCAAVAGSVAGIVAVVALTTSDGTPGDSLQWKAIGLLAGLVVVASIVALFVAERRCTHATVSIELDASRRWVTISRVHPAFTAACHAHEQRQRQRT